MRRNSFFVFLLSHASPTLISNRARRMSANLDYIAPEPRPRKRPRVSPPPPQNSNPPPAPLPSTESTSDSPRTMTTSTPIATIPLQHPSAYLNGDPSRSTFQLPTHLTSFSYSPTRELLLDNDRRDESLAIYKEPRMGSDLNRGFEQAVWRDGSVDEGLDSLLDT